ncbi:MAG: PilT/PilU family type 4a pilus ATPase [Candidatus Edwardsbacteria bacterium]|nr:PilT/PilU family type 4a pilus ATPase [Candidatus Edwardsbacteria bacterium]
MNLCALLKFARMSGASDLHLVSETPPFIRVNGEIIIMEQERLSPPAIRKIIAEIATPEQIKRFESEKELCLSISLPEIGYFRVTLYYQRGNLEAAIRLGISQVKTFEELGLPPVAAELSRKKTGLLIIAGATGMGKTTTFNAVIDFINRERRCKIITIEDPVEFIHAPFKSIIVQQEAYSDSKSFARALIHILRQDPDIIGLGEMRDLETISTALTAAETGHLVIATLHTINAAATVERVIDVFPAHQQAQIRYQFSTVLLGIICQRLLPMVDQKGRALACEVLIANHAVRNMIKENKAVQIDNAIRTGGRQQMQAMDDVLKDLYLKGVISYDTAVTAARDPAIFDKLK